MSGFSAEWLALREPADARARDPGLLRAAAAFAGAGLVVDLGCGTGSMMRALRPHLAARARFRLVDDAPDLLAAVAVADPSVDLVRADLSVDLGAVAGARLVTASALLDLVSAGWLDRLVAAVTAERAGFYAPLNYDGRAIWSPPLSGDAPVLAGFNRHQRGDKGFGPALGASAAAEAAARFARAGYRVETAQSPWRFEPARIEDAQIVRAVAYGMQDAARAIDAGSAAAFDAWLAARMEAAGDTTLVVGHTDLLALPA